MNTCQSRFVLFLSYPNISEKVQDNSKIFISRQLKTVAFYFEEPPPNKHTHQISQKKVNGHRKLRNKKARMNKMQNNHKFRKHGMTWSTEPSAPLKFLGTISDSSWELSGKWWDVHRSRVGPHKTPPKWIKRLQKDGNILSRSSHWHWTLPTTITSKTHHDQILTGTRKKVRSASLLCARCPPQSVRWKYSPPWLRCWTENQESRTGTTNTHRRHAKQ